MAEGDSILRIAQRIDSFMAGSEVTARIPGRRRPEGRSASDLDGRELTRAESRGKHLLLHFEGGLVLHSHLGMKGAWHVYRRGDRWRNPAAAAWIAITGPTAEAVNFNGDLDEDRARSRARAGTAASPASDPTCWRPEMTPEAAAAALRRAGPETELGDALLDQQLVAGIGNIFKSESCWAVKADPWKRLGDVDDDQLAEVAGAARDQMLEAVRSGGRPQKVYRRARRPCPRCRTAIRSLGQGDSAPHHLLVPRTARVSLLTVREVVPAVSEVTELLKAVPLFSELSRPGARTRRAGRGAPQLPQGHARLPRGRPGDACYIIRIRRALA